MIPYEELVTALSRWRAQRGLSTGLGDTLGEPPAPTFDGAAPDYSQDDVVEIGDEILDGAVEEQSASFDADERFPELGEESTQQAVLADVARPPAPAPEGKPGRSRRASGRRRNK